MVYHLSIRRDLRARLTNREIRFEVHSLSFAFATLLGAVWTNIDRPLLFLLDCPLSVLFDHQQLVLCTVHLSSINRPLKFKTVHFRDRLLSPLWSVHFHPDSRIVHRTFLPLAFCGIQEFRMLRASVHRMDLWSASIKLKIGLSVVQFTLESIY